MVEASNTEEPKSEAQHPHGILKHDQEGEPRRGVKFDEAEIAAYDA